MASTKQDVSKLKDNWAFAKDVEARAVRVVAERKKGAATNAIEVPELGETETLPDFISGAAVLSQPDKARIVEAALVLIDDLFVHLPLKRAMHAIDPVQRLKLLQRRIGALEDRAFHSEMIDIFVRLRDLHTNYLLPNPYRSRTAFLPFLLEEFWQGGERHYLVSRLIAGFSHPSFGAGVEVTHWNGMPIDRAVTINADREAGSNEDARHVRGLDRMTVRPMIMSLPPDAEWVDVGYNDGTLGREIRLDWNVFDSATASGADGSASEDVTIASALGLDLLTEETNRAKKALFASKALDQERKILALGEAGRADQKTLDKIGSHQSTLPNIFSFEARGSSHGQVGYVRIWSFSAAPSQFIDEFIRIAGLLPQDGLIIDVRGNGGGTITAGERLLQLLTPREIEAERLHFINTGLTERLCQTVPWLAQWLPSIVQSVQTGAIFSQGFPIEPPSTTNALGQHYLGPVVLITDAKCYSTTDIFAAGFKDHKIGKILGVDGNTGAGGANVWPYDLLQALLPGPDSPIQPLPAEAGMRVAIRRTTRVKEHAGQPLEDLGVLPDERYDMTRDDVLGNNQGLIDRAAGLLRSVTVRAIDGVAQQPAADVIKVTVTTQNIGRLDCVVDGRPTASVDVADGENTFTVPSPSPNAGELRLRGFVAGELVAAKRLSIA